MMHNRRLTIGAAMACAIALPAHATDIAGVQWFALDQPQVNVSVWQAGHDPGDAPISWDDPLFGESSSFSAFLDTGASGIVFSEMTADRLGLLRERSANNDLVTFGDVGIGGGALFNVSTPIDIGIARYESPLLGGGGGSVSPMVEIGSVRAQIGPLNAGTGTGLPGIPDEIIDPGDLLNLFSDINIVGMPAIQSRVMVMDARGVDTALQNLGDGLQTWLYNPGSVGDGTAGNPGIPKVGRQVQLSFANFDQFNAITPDDAERPTTAANPMIGSNRLTAPGRESPGVTVRYGDSSATGSFLLDTGAQSSFISTAMAAQLGVRNKVGPNGEILPDLEARDASGNFVDIDEFVTDVGGIGGSAKVAGFRLSSLLLRTTEGDARDENDPNHLRFLDAPVFVLDIPVGEGNSRFTLDGVLGMNYLVASMLFDLEAFTSSGNLSDLFGEFREGAFDWLVVDTVNGRLGLNLKAAAVPLPTAAWLLVAALTGLLPWTRRRR